MLMFVIVFIYVPISTLMSYNYMGTYIYMGRETMFRWFVFNCGAGLIMGQALSSDMDLLMPISYLRRSSTGVKCNITYRS